MNATQAEVLDPRDEEVQTLRRSMNDLLSVLALPAMWRGNEGGKIIHTLTEALRAMLALDLVYIALDSKGDGSPVEAALASPDLEISNDASKVGVRLCNTLGERRDAWPATARGSLG